MCAFTLLCYCNVCLSHVKLQSIRQVHIHVLVQVVLKHHSQSVDTGSTWSRKYPLSWLWCMKETLKMV